MRAHNPPPSAHTHTESEITDIGAHTHGNATGGAAGFMSAADKSKLDGVEAGATADQTGAEIKAAYEAEANTNAFTDAEQSKLAGIEAGATADQSAAEVPFTPAGDIAATTVQTAIVEVRDDTDAKLATKAAASHTHTAADVDSGAALDGQVMTADGLGGSAWETPASGVTDHGLLTGLADDDHAQYLLASGTRAMTGALNMGSQNITSVGTVDGRDVSADGSKLDGIESGADVTDATNVAAAGAVMDSDISAAEGFLRKTGAGAYEAIKSNLSASTDPGVNDDNTAGYAVGSEWINTTAGTTWRCVNASTAAADWNQLDAAGGSAHAMGSATHTADTLANLNTKISDATLHGAHTGDVTGNEALTIASGVVTLAKMANLAQDRLIGRVSTGTGVPEALTPAQVRDLLGAQYTITDGATVTLNGANGVNQKVTLGGNRTIVCSNLVVGQAYALEILQDSTAQRIPFFDPTNFAWNLRERGLNIPPWNAENYYNLARLIVVGRAVSATRLQADWHWSLDPGLGSLASDWSIDVLHDQVTNPGSGSIMRFGANDDGSTIDLYVGPTTSDYRLNGLFLHRWLPTGGDFDLRCRCHSTTLGSRAAQIRLMVEKPTSAGGTLNQAGYRVNSGGADVLRWESGANSWLDTLTSLATATGALPEWLRFTRVTSGATNTYTIEYSDTDSGYTTIESYTSWADAQFNDTAPCRVGFLIDLSNNEADEDGGVSLSGLALTGDNIL